MPLALGTGSPLRSVRYDGHGASKPDSSFSAVFPHLMRDPAKPSSSSTF
ncbi:hypothetical protein [Pseudovibrio sp. Ad5]|nr:hypothetical protein [Pseudovibrio sp. Ad5]